MATIIVGAALAAILIGICVFLRRRAKRGGCALCPGGCGCGGVRKG